MAGWFERLVVVWSVGSNDNYPEHALT